MLCVYMCVYVHVYKNEQCTCQLTAASSPSSSFPLSFLAQGVEVFEEKLNPLCMQWLIDNGGSLPATNSVLHI